MIHYDDLTKSVHKHFYDFIVPNYYMHFSKQSIGTNFTHKLWIQPIWMNVNIFPACPNIVKVILKCQSVIDEDPLLTNLRQMVDFCTGLYTPDPYSTTNKIPLYEWDGTTVISSQLGEAGTFVKDIIELPISYYDKVAVININLNILICCYK